MENIDSVEYGNEDDLASLCEHHAKCPAREYQSGCDVVEGCDGLDFGFEERDEWFSESRLEGGEKRCVWLLVVIFASPALRGVLQRRRQRTQQEVARQSERKDSGECKRGTSEGRRRTQHPLLLSCHEYPCLASWV